jgi:hypothetical protein
MAERSNAEKWVQYLSAFDFSAITEFTVMTKRGNTQQVECIDFYPILNFRPTTTIQTVTGPQEIAVDSSFSCHHFLAPNLKHLSARHSRPLSPGVWLVFPLLGSTLLEVNDKPLQPRV